MRRRVFHGLVLFNAGEIFFLPVPFLHFKSCLFREVGGCLDGRDFSIIWMFRAYELAFYPLLHGVDTGAEGPICFSDPSRWIASLRIVFTYIMFRDTPFSTTSLPFLPL